MTRTRSRLSTAAASVAGLVTAALVLSGCSAIDSLTGSDGSSASSAASPTATATPYPSQFTRDGTFQSHIRIDGMDYVYTLYPTKSTPRTNEWYPKGSKYYSFTFQAYDLTKKLRAPFATKRKVYLSRIKVESDTLTYQGGKTEHPYSLDAEAKTITFDPEPVSTKYGMLITSPKGAFELRNQEIKATSQDTKGIDLHFTATVYTQTSAGATTYKKMIIKQKVPIAIFPNEEPTQVQSIPVDAN